MHDEAKIFRRGKIRPSFKVMGEGETRSVRERELVGIWNEDADKSSGIFENFQFTLITLHLINYATGRLSFTKLKKYGGGT